MDDLNLHYSGMLYEWPVGAIKFELFEKITSISDLRIIYNTQWETFIYSSNEPLRQEDRIFNISGPFKYRFIMRRSGPRLLILSENITMVLKFMEMFSFQALSPPPSPVTIHIEHLVHFLSKNPTEYALSYVHARVPAFGVSLKSISFYGDDLASASFFKTNFELLNPFICGIKHLKGGSEIGRLYTDGKVSFSFSIVEKIIEFERLLTFLRDNKFLS
jgi:hypothetical protein